MRGAAVWPSPDGRQPPSARTFAGRGHSEADVTIEPTSAVPALGPGGRDFGREPHGVGSAAKQFPGPRFAKPASGPIFQILRSSAEDQEVEAACYEATRTLYPGHWHSL